VNLTVWVCPEKIWWLASTNSIRTLCGPTGKPAMSIVLLSLASVLSQWRPKKEQNWTYYFVYAGRRYALPKVERYPDGIGNG